MASTVLTGRMEPRETAIKKGTNGKKERGEYRVKETERVE